VADSEGREEWVPAFAGQRPPFGRGNDAALRHGVYSERELGPLREALEQLLAETSPQFAEADGPARRILAAKIARVEQGYRYLDEHGAWDESGEQRPIVEQLRKDEAAARSYMRELGMTTLSRAELRLDQANTMVAIAEVQEVVRLAFATAGRFVPKEKRAEFMLELEQVMGGLQRGVGDGA
jgi:hypothetical protein